MHYTGYQRRWNPLLWLLGFMLACFFGQVFCKYVFGSDLVGYWLGLTQEGVVKIRLWELVSYVFAHDTNNPFHIICNMLVIFMTGRILQEEMGERRFVWASIWSAIGGAAFFLLFHLRSPEMMLIGASGISMGLLTVYCLAHAEEPMTFLIFFVFPVTVRPKILLWIMIVIEVIMSTAELQGYSQVASSAHLGGMLAAFLYFRICVQRRSPVPLPRWMSRRKQPARRIASSPRFTLNITSRSAMKDEVDRILDKINSQGFGSLTEEEKQLLDRAKDVLSNK
jgi:membrane associated rhomboid family serine protease